MFRFSEAKNVKLLDKIFLLALVFGGVLSILRFGDWWFRKNHIGVWWLYILLSLFFLVWHFATYTNLD